MKRGWPTLVFHVGPAVFVFLEFGKIQGGVCFEVIEVVQVVGEPCEI